MLELKNLTVKVGKKTILHNVNFKFERGKLYAIMGPNGSGKSTLAQAIMGYSAYFYANGARIYFNGEEISDLSPDKRAKKGLFLSFQTPLSLSGVNIHQLLIYALSGTMEPLAMRQKVSQYAAELKIDKELLSRSLNEGFSGGEKKKMEVLQAAMLEPRLVFFDEVDTGVDIDAMKAISRFINKMKKKDTTFVLITHYNRILHHIKPDKVLVMKKGKLVKSGGAKLAEQIEKEGYESINSK